MHALRFLERALASDGSTLSVLRLEGLWDMAYGTCFFFFGPQQEQQVTVHVPPHPFNPYPNEYLDTQS